MISPLEQQREAPKVIITAFSGGNKPASGSGTGLGVWVCVLEMMWGFWLLKYKTLYSTVLEGDDLVFVWKTQKNLVESYGVCL